MHIIASVDRNWGIGYQGNLLVRIPADMQMFQKKTLGKVIVMGRKTLESFPGGRPLFGRVNIVLTRQQDYQIKGARIVHGMEEAIELLKSYSADDIYIIGGQSIYEQFMPFSDSIYLTRLDYVYQADAYFPNLESSGEWELIQESEEQTYFDLEYYFIKYKRKT